MEMGGTKVSASCAFENSEKGVTTGSFVTSTRKFQEPGTPADDKPYSGLCFNNNQFYSENFRAHLIDEGLPSLELDSRNDFIPDGFWFYFK